MAFTSTFDNLSYSGNYFLKAFIKMKSVKLMVQEKELHACASISSTVRTNQQSRVIACHSSGTSANQD